LSLFSSRRRHTRSKRDWSSDVCSSDLRLILLLYWTAFLRLVVWFLFGLSFLARFSDNSSASIKFVTLSGVVFSLAVTVSSSVCLSSIKSIRALRYYSCYFFDSHVFVYCLIFIFV